MIVVFVFNYYNYDVSFRRKFNPTQKNLHVSNNFFTFA